MLEFPYNYFDGPTKLFLNLCLIYTYIFRCFSKIFFPCTKNTL